MYINHIHSQLFVGALSIGFLDSLLDDFLYCFVFLETNCHCLAGCELLVTRVDQKPRDSGFSCITFA